VKTRVLGSNLAEVINIFWISDIRMESDVDIGTLPFVDIRTLPIVDIGTLPIVDIGTLPTSV
jgi:hypothetical protein